MTRLSDTGKSISDSPDLLCGCNCRSAKGNFCVAITPGGDGLMFIFGDFGTVSTAVGSAVKERLKILVFTRAGVLPGESACLDGLFGKFDR